MMLSNHCVILVPDLFWIWGHQSWPCSSFQYSVDHVEFGNCYLAYNRCSSSILPLPCRDKLWAVELSSDDSGADRRSITWSSLPNVVTFSPLSALVTALEVNCQKEDNDGKNLSRWVINVNYLECTMKMLAPELLGVNTDNDNYLFCWKQKVEQWSDWLDLVCRRWATKDFITSRPYVA